MSEPLSFASLADLRLLRVSGADATEFLQAQLALDVAGLAGNGARLAPWLNAKGRVTGLFSLARVGQQDWLLGTHESLIGAQAKRLQMFVLRSAVTITPQAEWAAVILARGAAADGEGPLPAAADGHSWTETDGLWCRNTAPGCQEVWGPVSALAELSARGSQDPTVLQHWQQQWVLNGWPRLTVGEQDRFTAHMLNLDLLDAVSFTKGCYPGQEVVARTQNLGRPKRRALLFTSTAALPEPGQAVVDQDGRSWGEVVNSAAGQPHAALVVVTLKDLPAQLALGNPDGPAVHAAPLPFAIPQL